MPDPCTSTGIGMIRHLKGTLKGVLYRLVFYSLLSLLVKLPNSTFLGFQAIFCNHIWSFQRMILILFADHVLYY